MDELDDFQLDEETLKQIEEEARRSVESHLDLDDDALSALGDDADLSFDDDIELDEETLREIEREALRSVGLDDYGETIPDTVVEPVDELISDVAAAGDEAEDYAETVAGVVLPEAEKARRAAERDARHEKSDQDKAAAAPAAKKPEAGKPEAGKPEAGKPEADKPKAQPSAELTQTGKAKKAAEVKAKKVAVAKAKKVAVARARREIAGKYKDDKTLVIPTQSAANVANLQQQQRESKSMLLIIGGGVVVMLILIGILAAVFKNKAPEPRPTSVSPTTAPAARVLTPEDQAADAYLDLIKDLGPIKKQMTPDNIRRGIEMLTAFKEKYPAYAGKCDKQIERFERTLKLSLQE